MWLDHMLGARSRETRKRKPGARTERAVIGYTFPTMGSAAKVVKVREISGHGAPVIGPFGLISELGVEIGTFSVSEVEGPGAVL